MIKSTSACNTEHVLAQFPSRTDWNRATRVTHAGPLLRGLHTSTGPSAASPACTGRRRELSILKGPISAYQDSLPRRIDGGVVRVSRGGAAATAKRRECQRTSQREGQAIRVYHGTTHAVVLAAAVRSFSATATRGQSENSANFGDDVNARRGRSLSLSELRRAHRVVTS